MNLKLLAGAVSVAAVSGAASSQDLLYEPGADATYNWASYEEFSAMDLSGETLTLFGPWLGPDLALFSSVIAYFEAATGASVDYSGSDSFEQQILIDTQAGSAPNISIFPQPGVGKRYGQQGISFAA